MDIDGGKIGEGVAWRENHREQERGTNGRTFQVFEALAAPGFLVDPAAPRLGKSVG